MCIWPFDCWVAPADVLSINMKNDFATKFMKVFERATDPIYFKLRLDVQIGCSMVRRTIYPKNCAHEMRFYFLSCALLYVKFTRTLTIDMALKNLSSYFTDTWAHLRNQ